MQNITGPNDVKKDMNDEKIVNDSQKIVNGEDENLYEPTNEERWVDDVNEEFGEDNILPDEDEDDIVEY